MGVGETGPRGSAATTGWGEANVAPSAVVVAAPSDVVEAVSDF
jgi:hypothetical protein